MKIFFILNLLFYSSVQALAANDIVNASQIKQYQQTIKRWQKLADDNNDVAQFNLAKYYLSGVGVQKNRPQADEWFKRAARAGLIEAYLQLNNKAVIPGQGIHLNFDVGPTFWLDKQEASFYTIQIASSRKESRIKKYYTQNKLKGIGGYFKYVRDGKTWYALLYGSYKTASAANAAIITLPEVFRKRKPWIRKIDQLRQLAKKNKSQ